MLGGKKTSNNSFRIRPKETSNYLLNNFNEKPLYPLNDFKEKTINIPEVNTKNIKSNLNNDNYTDADSLVEYFHGMLLNYIGLEKNNGELNDQSIKLINIINDFNKQKLSNKIKINGGSIDDYQYDILNVTDNYILYNNIKVIYTYKYNEINKTIVHNINIYSNIENNNVTTDSSNNSSNEMEIEEDSEDYDSKDYDSESINSSNKMEIENNNNETNNSSINSSNKMEIENNNNFIGGYTINEHKNKIITKMKGGDGDDNKGFNLVIDFANNVIYETKQKIKTKNVYESGGNINYLLEKIIEKMIYILYDNNDNWLTGEMYNDAGYAGKNEGLYQSVLSLLIIIFSFRNNINKEIYTKYNHERYLMDMYKKIYKHKYLFSINNNKIKLTYDGIMSWNYVSEYPVNFRGDCALNVLTCVKNEDIQQMLIIKKKIIEKSGYSGDEIDYIKTIQGIINKFNCDDNIKNIIEKYVENFDSFINSIDYNYKLFSKINFNQEKASVDLDKHNIVLDKLKDDLELFITYGSTIFDILMDYNEENYLIDSIVRKKKKNYIKKITEIKEGIEDEIKDIQKRKDKLKRLGNQQNNMKKIKNTFSKCDLKTIKEIYTEYYNIINTKINTKINTDLFYVNMIISLLLIIYKINYLFDEKVFEIFKYSNKKRYAMRRFNAVFTHQNELDKIRFNCRRYNNHDYLFRYMSIPGHALLLIMDVDINNLKNKKYSICDLNDLNFATLNNNLNINNEENLKYREPYNFGITRFTSSYYAELTNISKKLLKENKLTKEELYKEYANKRNKEKDIMYKNMCCCFIGLENMNDKLKTMNDKLKILKNKFPNTYDDETNLTNIIKTTDINIYNKCKTNDVYINNYFKTIFYNILHEIFIKKYSYDPIKYRLLINIQQNILDNPKCINDNFPYYLIKELYDIIKDKYYNDIFKYYGTDRNPRVILKINNIFEFYSDSIIGYDEFDTPKIQEYFKYLTNEKEVDEFYQYIYKILSTYYYAFDNLSIIFDGGEQLKINDSSHNNSIIKKILIILLVIVIIIIIVLIVLYIINKYKNNNP